MKISASALLLALCLSHSSQEILVRAFVTSPPPLSPQQHHYGTAATTTSLQMGYLDNLGRSNDDNDDDDRGRRPPPEDPNADMRDYLSKSPHLTNPTTATSGDYDQRRGVGITNDQRVMNTKQIDMHGNAMPPPPSSYYDDQQQEQQQQYGSAQAPRTSGGEYNMNMNGNPSSNNSIGYQQQQQQQQPFYDNTQMEAGSTTVGVRQNDNSNNHNSGGGFEGPGQQQQHQQPSSSSASLLYSQYDPNNAPSTSFRRIWESPRAHPIPIPENTPSVGDFRQGVARSVKTLQVPNAAERMQVVLKNRHDLSSVMPAPNMPMMMTANLDVWIPGVVGPKTPLQVSVWSEDGNLRPLNMMVDTPPPSPNGPQQPETATATISIRNTGEAPQQQPAASSLEAYLVVDTDNNNNNNDNHASSSSNSGLTQPHLRAAPIMVEGGGIVQEFDVARMIPPSDSVQVFLDSQGRPLSARLEVVEVLMMEDRRRRIPAGEEGRVLQVVDLYEEESLNVPLFFMLEVPTPTVPGVTNIVRVVNTGAPEFPLAVSVEPMVMMDNQQQQQQLQQENQVGSNMNNNNQNGVPSQNAMNSNQNQNGGFQPTNGNGMNANNQNGFNGNNNNNSNSNAGTDRDGPATNQQQPMESDTLPPPPPPPPGGGMMLMNDRRTMGDPYFDDDHEGPPGMYMDGMGAHFNGPPPYDEDDYERMDNDYGRNRGYGVYGTYGAFGPDGGIEYGVRPNEGYWGGSNGYTFGYGGYNYGGHGGRRTYVGNGYRVSGSFYDINKGRPGSGFKVMPGAGSRFNGRGELVDNGNMGAGIRYAASSVPQFGRRRYD